MSGEMSDRSWWVGSDAEFSAALPDNQARMRRELEPKAVREWTNADLWLEQQELLGHATARNPVIPAPEPRKQRRG